MFNRVLLIGTGLIGSSIAWAIKKHAIAPLVIGCSKTEQTINKALELGFIDSGGTNMKEQAVDADLIILCSPLSTYAAIAQTIAPSLKSEAIITDVGSVKKHPTDAVVTSLSAKQGSFFVPGHPIAGTEQSGPEAGFAELFEGKTVILTPTDRTNKVAIKKVEEFWTQLGAKVSYLTPEKHDVIYANVSHVIQFLAFAYRLSFSSSSFDNDPSFMRFYRIARSKTGLWLDIFAANRDNMLACLEKFKVSFYEHIEQSEPGVALPTLISQSIKDITQEYKEYAGSGYKDFTSAAGNSPRCEQELRDALAYIATVDQMIDALRLGNLHRLLPLT